MTTSRLEKILFQGGNTITLNRVHDDFIPNEGHEKWDLGV